MKKVVISGSSKLQDKVKFWSNYFEEKGYKVIDYPKIISKDILNEMYPVVFTDFYKSLEKSDVYFLMNEDKNGINGYIGAGSFAELNYVVIQNLIYNKNIEIYILNMPSREFYGYDEVKLWLDLGWIKLYDSGK